MQGEHEQGTAVPASGPRVTRRTSSATSWISQSGVDAPAVTPTLQTPARGSSRTCSTSVIRWAVVPAPRSRRGGGCSSSPRRRSPAQSPADQLPDLGCRCSVASQMVSTTSASGKRSRTGAATAGNAGGSWSSATPAGPARGGAGRRPRPGRGRCGRRWRNRAGRGPRGGRGAEDHHAAAAVEWRRINAWTLATSRQVRLRTSRAVDPSSLEARRGDAVGADHHDAVVDGLEAAALGQGVDAVLLQQLQRLGVVDQLAVGEHPLPALAGAGEGPLDRVADTAAESGVAADLDVHRGGPLSGAVRSRLGRG